MKDDRSSLDDTMKVDETKGNSIDYTLNQPDVYVPNESPTINRTSVKSAII